MFRIVFCCGALVNVAAHAGGPLAVCNNAPLKYTGSGMVSLSYDQGPLGSRSKAQVDALLTAAVSLWTNVDTATVTLARGADLPVDVTALNYTTYYGKYSDGINPVIYDTDGSIIDLIMGVGAKNHILGFAGSAYSSTQCRYVEGQAVINGFISVSDASLQIVVAHEIGHLIGLDHTELDNEQGLSSSNYPLMYPIAYRSSASLHEDDIAAVSALYPDTTLGSVYGQLSGTLTQASGLPVLGANIWAREVNTNRAYSVVSDYLKQGTGYFKLLLPAGVYELHASAISAAFTGGSSVGPYSESATDISFQSPLYTGGVALSPVTLGGAMANRFAMAVGCVGTAVFKLDGTGSVGGNCNTPVMVAKVDVRSYVPAASAGSGYVSYLRIINTGTVATPVSVAVINGATGVTGAAGQLIATLPAHAALTFSAAQVEAALGMALAAGDRPRIRINALTTSSIEAQSFLLQPGGAFNEISGSMNGPVVVIRTYVPAAAAPSGYVSYLRVINTGLSASAVTVARVDPATGQTGIAGVLNALLPAGAAVTYSAAQVESALGISIAAGERPRMQVAATNTTLEVQSFLIQPGGAFTEVSTGQAGSSIDVRSYVPAATVGYTTYLRVINNSGTATPVTATLLDAAGGVAGASGTIIALLPAFAATTLSSAQVETAMGVSIPASSRPRIRVSSATSDLRVQSFLLQPGGAFNEMSGASSGPSVMVRTYIPAADAASGYTSYLRVINTGATETPVTVGLVDGVSGLLVSTGTLVPSLLAGAAQTFSSSQVEAALGSVLASGVRPIIQVSGNTTLEVQSFLTQPGGAFTEVSNGQ